MGNCIECKFFSLYDDTKDLMFLLYNGKCTQENETVEMESYATSCKDFHLK